MRRLNTIALERRAVRRHADCIASEFLIDGCLLQEHLERATKRSFDLVSPIGWTVADYQRQYSQRLLLLSEPELPSGRRELLVCPECADVGCGCVSAEVRIADGEVSWSKLGSENNYDPDSLALFAMGAFVFRLNEYQALFWGYAEA